jgi:uncharacterized membrane protein (Fun14 family)
MVNPGQVEVIDSSPIDMVTMGNANNVGVIETIKGSLQPETIANKFGVDKNILIDVGVYGAIGFIVGFLLKKYSEYFISLVLLIVGLVVLQQFDYISLSINNVKIQSAFGLEGMPMGGNTYVSFLWDWASSHIISASSLGVGFLIGLKVG